MNLLIYLVVVLLPVVNAQDIGRVFIGQRNNNDTLTSLTFRVTSTTASVPVYIDVFRFNPATNSTDVVPVINNVLVTCEVTVQQTGYSSATFSTFTANNLNKDGTIRLSNLQSGRQTNIQCFGGEAPQFTKATSLSSSLPLTVTNVPSFKLYPSQTTTKVTSFNVLLLLEAVATDGTIDIRCQADTINSTAIVNQVLRNPLCFTTSSATVTTTTAPTAAPILPTEAPVVTPAWNILNPVLQLSPISKQYSSLLKVVRNLDVNTTVREYVVISCCSSNLGINISDSVLAVASLKPNVTEDWDKATDAASTTVEKTIQNPAYSEVAPCACDLTGNVCDVDCCCDADCVNMTSVFSSCIPGLVGGQSAPEPDYKCSSDNFNKEDWFVFMCVYWEYNSLLGFFYSTTPAIRKEEAFNEKLAGETYNSYREAELRTPSYNSLGSVGYRYGAAVQSIKMTNTRVDNIGLVALPQRVLSGECLSTTPLQYLKDVKTDCTVQLTENLCSITGRFNSLFYVISTSANNPAYSGLYGILDTPLNQKISNVSVNYYCTADFTGYIKSTVASSVSPTGNFTFNYTLPTPCVNDACPTPDSTAQVTANLPPRCSWDDGTTIPPEVVFNGGSNTCQNAVVDVKYNIYWRGTEITRLDAFVIMGDISVTPAPEVTQKYEATFIHDFDGNTTTFDNFLGHVNTSYNRSGSPGYDFEKPIWSGCPVYNATTGELINIETSSARQMSVWNTGIDGLCYNAGKRAVMFGEDTFTSCDLRMGLYEFSDCDKLRSLIINRVNSLMPSQYIGRYGYNDPTNTNYWIEVQREDLTDICLGNYNQSDMDILTYTMQGMCTNMITGIHLDIMYAETGRRNHTPIHEIIGAKISYPKSTWKLTCAAGGACSESSRYVESFPVTSSVHYIKVPGNTPARLERWEENRDWSICYQDVCWEELLYPLSDGYTADSRKYVLAVTLVLIIIFMAFLLITRPWW